MRFGEDLPLGQGATARLTHAGHIFGAASVRLALNGASVLFSGDLGRYDDLLMRDPADPPAADTLVIESTYGDRLHAGDDPSEALAAIVRRTVARGGTVLLPAFAVGRAQQLLLRVIEIRAEVATLHGLSAHADADDLLRWARAMPAAPRRVLVSHGEPAAAQALAAGLRGTLHWQVEVPATRDTADLDHPGH